ncbi:MAG: hypothetical protein DRI92_00390 [Aquificota bacterium]|nr:MAG: hypothetical protein DRI92_00390 [Aquificota bacterium]
MVGCEKTFEKGREKMMKMMKMIRKIVVWLIFALFVVGSGVVGAQSPPAKVRSKLLEQIKVVKPVSLRGTNLVPAVWVNCGCSCEREVESKGYLLVDRIGINIYNSGTAMSGRAGGKVEFFDVLTNKNVTLRFSVPAVNSKDWGSATPNHFSGIYLVRKSGGLKISITFHDTLTKKNYTNTRITKKCSVVE